MRTRNFFPSPKRDQLITQTAFLLHSNSSLYRIYGDLSVTLFSFPLITVINYGIVFLLWIIINFIIMKSNLHEEENHIYIRMIINPHKMEPKYQTVAMNCWNHLVYLRKQEVPLSACHRKKVFIAKHLLRNRFIVTFQLIFFLGQNKLQIGQELNFFKHHAGDFFFFKLH